MMTIYYIPKLDIPFLAISAGGLDGNLKDK